MGSTINIIKKELASDLSLTDGDRSFTAVMTSIATDRAGDVLLPDGMNSKDFEDNPVLLYGHDSYNLPVGKVAGFKREGTRILAKCTLAERPENHEGEWIPDTIHSLIKQGMLKGVSVSFLPESMRDATKKDKDRFGPECKTVITRWRLMELSIVCIPCNQEALIQAVSKKMGDTQKATAEASLEKRKITLIAQKKTAKLVLDAGAVRRKQQARAKCKLYY